MQSVPAPALDTHLFSLNALIWTSQLKSAMTRWQNETAKALKDNLSDLAN